MKINLKTLNRYIFKCLEELDNLENKSEMEKSFYIKKCNATALASKVIIASLKTQIDIVKLKETNKDMVLEIEKEVGFND